MDLGILLDQKLDMSQGCVFAPQRPNSIMILFLSEETPLPAVLLQLQDPQHRKDLLERSHGDALKAGAPWSQARRAGGVHLEKALERP